MPRYARLYAPGALVHVIARFVNREHRLVGPEERGVFLERLPLALARSDWTLLAFGLMSSHVHLALLAGFDPPASWLRPLHVAVARALNRADGRFGPVFAERATTIVMPPEKTPKLVGYIHNNPVRAGLVAEARESDWTSHRAWIGEVAAPRWLAVGVGLERAGFGTTPAARQEFDAFVRSQRAEQRDPRLAVTAVAQERAAVRALTALPVEISSRSVFELGDSNALMYRGQAPPTRWDGDLARVLERVAARLAMSLQELQSRRRSQAIVAARRVFAATVVLVLRREPAEVAAALAVSRPAVSQLLRRAGEVLEQAKEVAAEVRGAGAHGTAWETGPTTFVS